MGEYVYDETPIPLGPRARRMAEQRNRTRVRQQRQQLQVHRPPHHLPSRLRLSWPQRPLPHRSHPSPHP